MGLKAVFFDLDDTLYTSFQAGDAYAYEKLEEWAISTFGDKGKGFADAFRVNRKRLARQQPAMPPTHDRVLFAQGALERMGLNAVRYSREAFRVYWDAVFAKMTLRPGVAEFLDELRAAGVKVAICTNMLADIQMEKLEYLGIADKVDCLVTSEEAGVDKPGSAIFWLAMHKCRCLPEETVLTNATGAYGLAISEYMVAVWLELLKKLHLYRDVQRTGKWCDLGQVRSAWNSTVLVLGLGDIGGEFAKRAKALGARVIGVRRTGTDKPDFVDELIHTDKLDEYLPQADCVAITLPGTTATKGMFDAERMAKMKDGAILLNVGRGMIVDTDALCAALENGKLAGAGVDVTDPEPLPTDHPLWKMENAVITPHISGGYHLQETHDRIVRIMAENLKRFLAGEPLRNVIDFSTGYRKL